MNTLNRDSSKSQSLLTKINLNISVVSIVPKDCKPSQKLLRINVTPDLHLTYSKNGGNLGLVLKMKNRACISILLAKHVKYTYLYMFKFILYSFVTFKEN